MTDAIGRNHDGNFWMLKCPDCGAANIDARRALHWEQIDGGIRYVGVPCPTCDTTFIIETREAHTPEEFEQLSSANPPIFGDAGGLFAIAAARWPVVTYCRDWSPMSDAIAPVLTPEEFRNEGMDIPLVLGDIRYVDDPTDLAKVVALANHLLPDADPRKITWAMVDKLRKAVRGDDWVQGASTPGPEEAMLDALVSYLPPR